LAPSAPVGYPNAALDGIVAVPIRPGNSSHGERRHVTQPTLNGDRIVIRKRCRMTDVQPTQRARSDAR